MPFSFFGKKPGAPRPAPAAKLQRPAQPGPARAKTPAPRIPEPPRPKEEPLPNLDFAPAVEGEPGASAPGPAAREDPNQVHSVVEEVAILYANGEDTHAAEILEHAVQGEDAAAATEEVWFLLFDLYHVAGKREAFETRAVEYAVRFGRSPPAWSGAERSSARGTGGATPIVVLGPGFDGPGARQLDILERMASKHERVRADLGKLRSAGEPGCARLIEVLHAAKKRGCEVVLQNAANLSGILERSIEAGKRENPASWLLLLELYQRQGMQEKFEECAVNYAVTFEVSPPSWEMPRKQPPRSQPKTPPVPATPGAYVMSGDISGASPAVLRDLSVWAAAHDPVVIDCSALRRMDFVCAGTLLNTLAELKAAGRPARIRGANHLVGALLRVLGVAQFAQLDRRKS